ncbi:succinate dehydrogenase, cytochrome subunit [Stanieria sp. NIES-3757]|nr:succinate dehydrogenase, cytochrome subunit [Stanieria sp. NIES-3757]
MVSNSNKMQIFNFYKSPIGRKFITSITGISLILFVAIHLSGNLSFFISPETYNQLAYFINRYDISLNTIELILLLFFVVHAALGIAIQITKHQARPVGYDQYQSIGEPSKQSLSSRTMILTGLVLVGFLIFHLLNFKFGTYYPTVVNGVPMRDLARLVREKFEQPGYTFGYTGVMILLGLHLRHGIWSALQSLGLTNGRFSAFVYSLALVIAGLIAIGFIVLPLAIYWHLV